LHNFGVTASLKAWIDQVVRVGRTVEYPSFAGLVKGKKVTIISTRGGADLSPGESLAPYDAQVPYLKQIFAFIGIVDVSVIYAGNLAGSAEARQNSLDRALVRIRKLVSEADQRNLSTNCGD
jgi:FMN-dependent NADH-azoreductase